MTVTADVDTTEWYCYRNHLRCTCELPLMANRDYYIPLTGDRRETNVATLVDHVANHRSLLRDGWTHLGRLLDSLGSNDTWIAMQHISPQLGQTHVDFAYEVEVNPCRRLVREGSVLKRSYSVPHFYWKVAS